MKYFAFLSAWLVAFSLALAEGPDDQYVAIYNLIQEADKLAKNEQPAQALAKYLEAQTALQSLQRGYPEWNSNVLKFRMNYISSKVTELSAKVPAKGPAEAAPSPALPGPAAESTRSAAVAKLEKENLGLTEMLRQAQSDKALLEAKLKEALAARPAEVDPAQLAKAEEKVRSLEKENDLLQTALAQAKAKPAATPAKPVPAPDNKALEQSRKALAEANLKLAEQTEKATALEIRLKQLSAQPAPAVAAPTPPPAPETDKVKELASERDELRRKLEAALHEAQAKPAKPAPAPSTDLTTELLTLRTRLAVYESRALPYTPEELALMKKPEVKVAPITEAKPEQPGKAEPQPKREPPRGSTALAAQAQRYFSARQFDQAEAKYLEMLHQEPDNVFTLANLAATQLELNKLGDAETHVQHALKMAPDDAFSLSVLGHLKFRQRKYDDAAEALNHAALLDPQNAEIQNYLGVTLSQKGLRVPAETALRKAVQLSPGYADAHNNLALIYLSQTPPMTELARWHYQKALAAGSPPRPELEKLLDAKHPANGGQ